VEADFFHAEGWTD